MVTFSFSIVASLGVRDCLLCIAVHGYSYCYVPCACQEFMALEDLAVWSFRTKDLFDLIVLIVFQRSA